VLLARKEELEQEHWPGQAEAGLERSSLPLFFFLARLMRSIRFVSIRQENALPTGHTKWLVFAAWPARAVSGSGSDSGIPRSRAKFFKYFISRLEFGGKR